MRQLSKSAYGEFYWWGCNPCFVATREGVVLIDAPQQPIDAVRWREMITEKFGPIRYLINTEPHWDHIHGNAFFPGVEVIAQEGIAERYLPTIQGRMETVERMKETDPDSYFLCHHPSYPPNPPTRTFTDRFELVLGEHTFTIENCPGHTKPQTHVHLASEGVVFIGDNIFHKCMTWLQECNPWEWLDTLNMLEKQDLLIIPGHGEPCRRTYIKEQKTIIEGWLDGVEQFLRRGLSEEDAVKQPAPAVDPYPLAQRLHEWRPIVHERSIRNLYKQIAARQSAPAA